MLNQPNILVCSDFSTCSDLALRAAKNIRHRTQANVDVLNVIDHSVVGNWDTYESLTYSTGEALKKELLTHAKISLKEQLKSCELETKSEIRFGTPRSVILEKIQQDNIDLVIIGYTGKTPGQLRLGSLTSKILASSPVPVLVIKTPLEMKKLAALVDPHGPKEEIISWSEELTHLFSTQMIILSLFDDHIGRFLGENKEKFSEELQSLSQVVREEEIELISKNIRGYMSKFTNTQIIVRSNIESNIAHHLNSILKEETVDTIVMQKHKPTLLEKVFIGSETRRMLDLFRGNLLVLP